MLDHRWPTPEDAHMRAAQLSAGRSLEAGEYSELLFFSDPSGGVQWSSCLLVGSAASAKNVEVPASASTAGSAASARSAEVPYLSARPTAQPVQGVQRCRICQHGRQRSQCKECRGAESASTAGSAASCSARARSAEMPYMSARPTAQPVQGVQRCQHVSAPRPAAQPVQGVPRATKKAQARLKHMHKLCNVRSRCIPLHKYLYLCMPLHCMILKPKLGSLGCHQLY